MAASTLSSSSAAGELPGFFASLWPPWSSAWSMFVWTVSTNAITYGLLNKKWLPRTLWKPLSKAYFWPMLPIAVARRNLPWSQPYWAEVSSGVFLGAVPIVMLGHVDEFYKQGVRAVVNMQDEYSGPVAKYKSLGIKQLRLPTVDHVEPTVADLKAAVDFIKAQRESGGKVYVHCKGGHGRGAAVAFAWMLLDSRLGLEETQERLSAMRAVRKKLYRQRNIVAFFHKYCQDPGSI